MLMYHFNLGFPLISPTTELDFPKRNGDPGRHSPQQHVAEHTQLQGPTAGFSEHVYVMDVEPAADGFATARITNREAGFGQPMRFSADTLPHLVQWKQMGQGAYVLGVEPVNTNAMEGRADARAKGVLVELEPGREQAVFDHV